MGLFNGIKYDFGDKSAEVIYVYDALCGWCYGFSPVIMKVQEEFSDEFDFLIMSGGMIRDDNATPVSAIAPYIKSAYRDVEQLCGVKFGLPFLEGLLNDPGAVFNSVPAAKALAAFRNEKPGRSFEFASAIQKAIYSDGMPATDFERLAAIAGNFGLDEDDFIARMHSGEVKDIVNYEFQLVEGFGINGFPTVLLRKDNDIRMIARGYTTYKSLSERLRLAAEDR
jgi:putative protein-disulfide isomerase